MDPEEVSNEIEGDGHECLPQSGTQPPDRHHGPVYIHQVLERIGELQADIQQLCIRLADTKRCDFRTLREFEARREALKNKRAEVELEIRELKHAVHLARYNAGRINPGLNDPNDPVVLLNAALFAFKSVRRNGGQISDDETLVFDVIGDYVQRHGRVDLDRPLGKSSKRKMGLRIKKSLGRLKCPPKRPLVHRPRRR
ncbi:hypothetical protein SAMN05444166_6313 [Singulisphaera sp. GP187]|nr:hypothetical protein SAMN05444166_6313 [Singulisphaera sp. GP187]